MEAAKSVGMSYWQAMRFVILPQAIRRVLPPLGNNFISMLKDSALVSVMGVADITFQGKVYAASTFRFFETYNVVAYLYLIMTIALALGVRAQNGAWRCRSDSNFTWVDPQAILYSLIVLPPFFPNRPNHAHPNWLNRNEALTIADKYALSPAGGRARIRHRRPRGHQHADPGRQPGGAEGPAALYAGQVKCIYIDPPYNTRSAFAHYDDSLEHSTWLSMMLPRLELLRELLAEDGSIWVSIDDNEGHYLKVLMDEVFGRGISSWQIDFEEKGGASKRRKIGAIQ